VTPLSNTLTGTVGAGTSPPSPNTGSAGIQADEMQERDARASKARARAGVMDPRETGEMHAVMHRACGGGLADLTTALLEARDAKWIAALDAAEAAVARLTTERRR
jgi:hypothetical protein